MKPIAPQGEWLKSKILGGSKEIAIIFMGIHAQIRAEGFLPELPFTMYLPLRTSPSRFTWPVNDCEVWLVDTSLSAGSFVKHFVMCLFTQGAREIHYIARNINQKFIRSSS